MPSPLETLVKILKLERENGYKNSAVIGGLAAYSKNWMEEAHQHARKPEHHLLVDELGDLLVEYETIDGKNERHDAVTYMMDRIMGRVSSRNPEIAAAIQSERAAQAESESAPPPDDSEPSRIEPLEETDDEEHEKSPYVGAQHTAPLPGSPPFGKDSEVTDEAEVTEAKAPEPRPQQQVRQTDRRPQQQKRDRDRDTRKPPRRDSPRHESGGYEEAVDSWAAEGPTSRGRIDIPTQPRLARPPRKPRKPIPADEAADTMRGLNAEVQTIKGVGPRMAEGFRKLGIETINDLIFYLPRRYDDYTRLRYISKLQPNEVVTVIGTVKFTEVRTGRSARQYFYMEMDDGSGVLGVTFFGQPYLIKKIRKGMQLVISGVTSIYGNRLQMTNPEWEEVDPQNLKTPGIVPVYSLTKGITARSLRHLMNRTVNYWSERLPDYVPEAVLDRAELADLGWTIKNLHFPEGQDHLHHARTRFVFDQLLLLQLAILANRRDWQSVPAYSLTVTDDFLEPFLEAVFPYELTRAQRRAIEDIRRDISSDRPMNRLLQGDVGSGKTAVAVTAMAMAFANGKQAAIMAPTSILAEQHYRGITQTLESMPGENKPVVGLLTSALTTTEREAIYNGLADGSIDMIIGTHALIQENVEFKDLAIVVIDEQHRFGVGQRGALRGKGTNPHVLVMTATPIPRTLALTIYADLDLSIMDEMPPGRIPIQTRIVQPVERERIYSFIEAEIKKGRQAFVVHPLVEASDKIEARSAVEAFDHLKKVFFRYKVALLHGRMGAQEKDDIMAAFSRGEYDILATTSVAEVGVDIPNASTIVIEGANRFGLAQLHQFRGRVGRGQHASYCLLIPDNNTPDAEKRLQAMEDTNDGFQLAEIDWKLRGAGDLVGTRQSGRNALKIMDAMTPQLVGLAQREARTIYEEDPYLEQDEHRLLRQRVAMLYHEESDVS